MKVNKFAFFKYKAFIFTKYIKFMLVFEAFFNIWHRKSIFLAVCFCFVLFFICLSLNSFRFFIIF